MTRAGAFAIGHGDETKRALRAIAELLRAGRFIEAAQLCHDALRDASAEARPELVLLLAQALCKGGLHEEALAVLGQARQAGVEPALVDYGIARVHVAAGRPAPAYAVLRGIPAHTPPARWARWLAARTRLPDAWLDEEAAACRAACAEWAAAVEPRCDADERSPLREAYWAARAEPARVQAWRQRLDAAPGLKVGLAWAEDARHPHAHDRSLEFHLLGPLAAVPGITWYGLQPGTPAQEAYGTGDDLNFVPLAAMARKPDDAAALVRNLDLVISVDGPVADLAGRLECPVWVLLGEQPHWRWLHASGHPSYPGLRVFRRAGRGGWPALVHTVSTALRGWVAEMAASCTDTTRRLLGVAELIASRQHEAAEAGLVELIGSQPALGRDVIQAVWSCPRQAPVEALARQRAKVAPAVAWMVEDLLASRDASAGRLDEAWRRWDALLAAPGAPVAAWLHCAAAAMVAGDRQRVLRTFKSALARHPGVPELDARAGLCFDQLRARDRARAYLERAAQALPRRAAVLRILSGLTERAGAATQCLQAALLAWPHDPYCWWALGGHQEHAGARATALVCARRFAALRNDFHGHLHLSEVCRAQADHAGTLQAIEQALRFRPRDAEGLHLRALALQDLGRTDEAAAAFEAVLEVDAHHRSALYRLARLRPSQAGWLARFRAQAAGPGKGVRSS